MYYYYLIFNIIYRCKLEDASRARLDSNPAEDKVNKIILYTSLSALSTLQYTESTLQSTRQTTVHRTVYTVQSIEQHRIHTRVQSTLYIVYRIQGYRVHFT